MSLFSDILSSIGGDGVPKPPPPPLKRPSITNANRPSDELSKPVARLGLNGTSAIASTNGVKRKAEGEPVRYQGTGKSSNYTGTMSKQASSTSKPIPIEPPVRPLSAGSIPPKKSVPIAAHAAKAPSKGSYAEIIARAKAAQEERGGQHVGMIKHQKEQRSDKVSYLAHRKQGNDEYRSKADKLDRLKTRPQTPVLNGRIEKRARSHSPMKRPASASKAEKPATRDRPPRPAYNGTMRMASSKPRTKLQAKKRQDEYLGTDEEDNSDLANDDIEEEDDYGSDASSDNMEAGAFDIDEEEAAAARAARIEDAKELALEKKLKAEKEERKRKLEELSRKAGPKRY